MIRANKFTKVQERKIREVGAKIEQARRAKRLSIRQAADRTMTSSSKGHMTEATWRRTELGYTQVGVKGQTEMVLYRPKAETLMAIAEVVDLDGAELCKEVGLKPPPPLDRSVAIDRRFKDRVSGATEIEELKRLAQELVSRLQRLEE